MGCGPDVEVEGLPRAGRTAALTQRQDADDADAVALGKGQRVAGCDGVAGFQAMLAVQPQVARGDHLGRQVAPLEEARLNQPFVQPKPRLGRGVRPGAGPGQSGFEPQGGQHGKGVVGVDRLFDARRAGLIGLALGIVLAGAPVALVVGAVAFAVEPGLAIA